MQLQRIDPCLPPPVQLSLTFPDWKSDRKIHARDTELSKPGPGPQADKEALCGAPGPGPGPGPGRSASSPDQVTQSGKTALSLLKRREKGCCHQSWRRQGLGETWLVVCVFTKYLCFSSFGTQRCVFLVPLNPEPHVSVQIDLIWKYLEGHCLSVLSASAMCLN